jgi:hypothetical protein
MLLRRALLPLTAPARFGLRRYVLPSSHGASLHAQHVSVILVGADGALTEESCSLGAIQQDSRVSMRDLLEIEQPPSSSSSSRILPRTHAILFHLGPSRGVILRDRVLLFNTANVKSSISPRAAAEALSAHITDQMREPSLTTPPLELLAIDHILTRQVQRQEKRIAYSRHLFLAAMADNRSAGAATMPLATTLFHYETVSRGIMQCTRALLDDASGNALRLLCLTDRAEAAAGAAAAAPDDVKWRASERDGWGAAPVAASTLRAVELLLEAAHHRAAGTALKAQEMSRQLALKRDLLQLKQRAEQNALLQRTLILTEATLKTSIASVMLSTAMVVTGLFGQNLPPAEWWGGEANYPAFLASTAAASAALALGVRLFFVRGDALAGVVGTTLAQETNTRFDALQALLLNLDTRLDATLGTVERVVAELERRSQAGDPDSGFSKRELVSLHRSLENASEAESEMLFSFITNTPLGGRGDTVINLSQAKGVLLEIRALSDARLSRQARRGD